MYDIVFITRQLYIEQSAINKGDFKNIHIISIIWLIWSFELKYEIMIASCFLKDDEHVYFAHCKKPTVLLFYYAYNTTDALCARLH